MPRMLAGKSVKVLCCVSLLCDTGIDKEMRLLHDLPHRLFFDTRVFDAWM